MSDDRALLALAIDLAVKAGAEESEPFAIVASGWIARRTIRW